MIVQVTNIGRDYPILGFVVVAIIKAAKGKD
jgi:hypothetical protein